MYSGRLVGTLGVLCVLAAAGPVLGGPEGQQADGPSTGVAATPDGATIFRIFLADGSSLVSYGEPARVGERVVFSMPTSALADNPGLHLVNLGADRVDWDRTERYAESARASRYMATRAEHDYALLTDRIASTLVDVSATTDPLGRLAIVEMARRTLADWPGSHFGYKQTEVQQMLGMLDEIIADLRAAAGVEQFALTFVAGADTRPVREALLPLPTPKEAIEQTLLAARLSESSAERVSLLAVALGSIERDADVLPSDWRTEARRTVNASIAAELETDRQYQSLTSRILGQATQRARFADVRGIQRLLTEVETRDKALGSARPDAVRALVASVEAQLDAARRLRLARDRWELRREEFQKYGHAMTASLDRLDRLKAPLEDIKALAGSSPGALGTLLRTADQVIKALSAIAPPEEFRAAHALFVSATTLADNAGRIRREATLTGDIKRAWDASSAAAGALMLEARARSELQSLFRFPQLSQ
jgi:hypothetical protein